MQMGEHIEMDEIDIPNVEFVYVKPNRREKVFLDCYEEAIMKFEERRK